MRTPLPQHPVGRGTLTRMRRKPHWTALVAGLALIWCIGLLLDHFWVPDTWVHALGAGLVELPLWALGAFLATRRRKRRDQAPGHVE